MSGTRIVSHGFTAACDLCPSWGEFSKSKTEIQQLAAAHENTRSHRRREAYRCVCDPEEKTTCAYHGKMDEVRLEGHFAVVSHEREQFEKNG